jgi:crossover junction endodeoxyribonuclease RuvC
MLILGIDPGLDRTGYAVVSTAGPRGTADSPVVLDAGVIRTDARRPLGERLRQIEIGLEEVFDEHAIAHVAIEELYSHYKHPRTAILMGHARGVIMLAATRHGIEVEGLSATHVKKALTGNGHASKQQMQRAILVTTGLPRLPEPPDVADAIAVALAAMLRESAARRGRLRAGAVRPDNRRHDRPADGIARRTQRRGRAD